MSQFSTARGSIDDHLTQARALGLPTNLAGALGVQGSGHTLYAGSAGSLVRISAVISTPVAFLTGLGTGAALAGGLPLFTLPDAFKPHIARITGSVSLSAATATLSANTEIGLGSLVGSGANATLGAVDAAAEDIVEGLQLAAVGAGATVSIDGQDEDRAMVGTLGQGTTVYLNIASAASGTAATNILFKGHVSIWGIIPSHLI